MLNPLVEYQLRDICQHGRRAAASVDLRVSKLVTGVRHADPDLQKVIELLTCRSDSPLLPRRHVWGAGDEPLRASGARQGSGGSTRLILVHERWVVLKTS